MSEQPKLDKAHCDNIRAVLHVLWSSNTDTARAMLACEDAYVALSVGLALGMSVDRVHANVAELLTRDCSFGELKNDLAERMR